DAHASPADRADADRGRLRYAVEQGTQRERGPRGAGLRTVRALAPVAASAVDPPVAEEEDDGAGDQPEDGRDATGLVVGLTGELEGERADEHAGADGHDPA